MYSSVRTRTTASHQEKGNRKDVRAVSLFVCQINYYHCSFALIECLHKFSTSNPSFLPFFLPLSLRTCTSFAHSFSFAGWMHARCGRYYWYWNEDPNFILPTYKQHWRSCPSAKTATNNRNVISSLFHISRNNIPVTLHFHHLHHNSTEFVTGGGWFLVVVFCNYLYRHCDVRLDFQPDILCHSTTTSFPLSL